MAPGANWVTVTLQPSGSQPGACLCIWTMSGDTFACYDWRQGATGDWGVERPGVPLNTPPYTGQPSQRQRNIPSQMSIAEKCCKAKVSGIGAGNWRQLTLFLIVSEAGALWGTLGAVRGELEKKARTARSQVLRHGIEERKVWSKPARVQIPPLSRLTLSSGANSQPLWVSMSSSIHWR